MLDNLCILRRIFIFEFPINRRRLKIEASIIFKNLTTSICCHMPVVIEIFLIFRSVISAEIFPARIIVIILYIHNFLN